MYLIIFIYLCNILDPYQLKALENKANRLVSSGRGPEAGGGLI